jgi:inner membrane transporter RhtA
MRSERTAAATQVSGAVAVQIGAAIGATVFPLVGPIGVVAARQFVAAVLLGAIARPDPRRLGWRRLRPALVLGASLVVMNLSLYAAVERVGLGLAVTLEFLGPLAVALWASRRVLDAVLAVAAGVGVCLLTGTVPGLDIVGVLFGLLAAVAWAAYIVFTRRAGAALPGIQGMAIASIVAAVATSPLLVLALVGLSPAELGRVALVGLAVGVLSSALPYSIDLLVLRRMRPELFGVLQSVQPLAAMLAGFVILGQTLAVPQIAGAVVISAANAVAVLAAPRRREPAAPVADQALARSSSQSSSV